MTAVDIEGIRARAAAATPGPWAWFDRETDEQIQPGSADGDTFNLGLRTTWERETQYVGRLPKFVLGCVESDGDDEIAANSAFIAHAREDVPALLGLVDELLAELDGRGEEARERWVAEQMRQSGLRSISFRNGVTMELEPAKDMIAGMVAAARTLLAPDGVEAPNYTETVVEFSQAGEFERYAFVVQRVAHDKLTPHQARQKAEAERDTAVAHTTAVLGRVRDELAGWQPDDPGAAACAAKVLAALAATTEGDQ